MKEMVATFSIVGFDPETDSLGVAVQSMFLAVGALVPYARAAVGARLGYLEGHDPGDGETLLDSLTDFLHLENFEEREQELGYLDLKVLRFMRSKRYQPHPRT